MVPKVAGKGKSFKGAGLYYLHDKKASTSERVAFTLTENLATDDPQLALRYMAFTAMRQEELKAASGAAMTGRKLVNSVYTYSLSWAPGETPSQEEMIAAGRETLKVLGLTDHEILMVAHKDEPHPHLHLIVNRVHPETGLAAKLSKDHLELSKWAEGYERSRGEILCPQRPINNERRRRGEFVKDTASLNTAAFVRWRKERLKAAHAVRQAEEKNLSAYHKGQRQALFDAKERRIEQRRRDIQEQFRPTWANLYRVQTIEANDLFRSQRSAFSRLVHWIGHKHELPQKGLLKGALEAVLGRHDYASALWAKHETQRRELANHVKARAKDAIAREEELHHTELDMLRHDQAEAAQALSGTHAQQSQDLAREIREGRDVEKFAKEDAQRRREQDRERPLHQQFRDRVRARIRKARKRDERGKGQGRERDS